MLRLSSRHPARSIFIFKAQKLLGGCQHPSHASTTLRVVERRVLGRRSDQLSRLPFRRPSRLDAGYCSRADAGRKRYNWGLNEH